MGRAAKEIEHTAVYVLRTLLCQQYTARASLFSISRLFRALSPLNEGVVRLPFSRIAPVL